jgi:hypothetical protein
MTVLRLISSSVIRARQVCKGAPWAVPEADLAGLDTRTALLRRPQPQISINNPVYFNDVARWVS